MRSQTYSKTLGCNEDNSKGLSASGSKANSLTNYRLSTSWCLFEVFLKMFFSFFWQSVVSQSPCLCGFRWVQDSWNWQKWPCTSARHVKKWVFCAGSTTFLFEFQIPSIWDYFSSLEAVSDRSLDFDVSECAVISLAVFLTCYLWAFHDVQQMALVWGEQVTKVKTPEAYSWKDTRIEVPTAGNFRMLSNQCDIHKCRILHLEMSWS